MSLVVAEILQIMRNPFIREIIDEADALLLRERLEVGRSVLVGRPVSLIGGLRHRRDHARKRDTLFFAEGVQLLKVFPLICIEIPAVEEGRHVLPRRPRIHTETRDKAVLMVALHFIRKLSDVKIFVGVALLLPDESRKMTRLLAVEVPLKRSGPKIRRQHLVGKVAGLADRERKLVVERDVLLGLVRPGHPVGGVDLQNDIFKIRSGRRLSHQVIHVDRVLASLGGVDGADARGALQHSRVNAALCVGAPDDQRVVIRGLHLMIHRPRVGVRVKKIGKQCISRKKEHEDDEHCRLFKTAHR